MSEPVNLEEIRAAAKSAKKAIAPAPVPDEPKEAWHRFLGLDCPVTPLGVHGMMRYYLDADRQLIALAAKDHGRSNLVGLFGLHIDWLYRAFPRTNKEGEVVSFRPEIASEKLMSACSACGNWDPAERQRGRGAWRGEDGELIVHLGQRVAIFPPIEQAWERQKDEKPGLLGRFVYPADPATAEPADAGGLAANLILERLETWSWRRPDIDPVLMLGWVGAAMIGGALAWRPTAWVTGGKGTGKSTLHDLLKHLFNTALVQLADTSEAYVRQRLQNQSLPVMVDELEAEEDNRRAQGIIRLARIAASGGMIGRGSAEHQGVEFTLRSAFMFSSILVPPLAPQDRSRIAVLELGKLPEGIEAPSTEPKAWREIGAQLRRRMIDGWWRLERTLAWFRRELQAQGYSARAADQFGTLLACADLALHDGDVTSESGGQWIRWLGGAQAEISLEDASDEERCLSHLLSSSVQHFTGGTKRSVGEWIAQASGAMLEAGQQAPSQDDKAEADRVLGRIGLKVLVAPGTVPPVWVLAVAHYHTGLAALFDETHWRGQSGRTGVWVQAIRRVPGAAAIEKPLWFAGATARATGIPVAGLIQKLPLLRD